MKYFYVIVVHFLAISVTAQDFQALKASPKSEWLKDAALLNNKNIVVLHSHNTKLNYIGIINDLSTNNNSLSTLSLYNEQMQLVKEKKLQSKIDSVIILTDIKNNTITKEIVATGVVYTPAGAFITGNWFDYDLNIKNSFVYKGDTLRRGYEPKLYVNSYDNIIIFSNEFNKDLKSANQ